MNDGITVLFASVAISAWFLDVRKRELRSFNR